MKNKVKNNFNNDDDLMEFVHFIVSDCYIISVQSPNRDSAFRIFSVLNNRGLDLTASDLIKSEIIGILEKKDSMKSEEYAQKWENLETLVGRDDFVDVLTYSRMILKKQKAQLALYDEFKEILNDISPEVLIDDYLTPYTETYNRIKHNMFPETVENLDEVRDILNWLKETENKDWMPVAIKFLTQIDYSNENIITFLKALERFTSFLLLTGKNWNQRPSRYAKILNSLENKDEFEQISNGKLPESIELTDDEKEEFRKVLEGDVFLLSAKKRKYLLKRLDSFVSDGMAQYKNTFTIEHILPQTPKDSYWLENWPNEEERDLWTHKLANLIPLSRAKNSAAKNWDFPKKKSKYFTSKKGITSYALATQVLKIKDWTPEVVKDRQDELLSILKEKWRL